MPKNPEFCLDLHILYMSGLFFSARSKCSQSTASNLLLDCRMYERCGIPCSHIFVITNEIEETMISVQVSERYEFISVNSYVNSKKIRIRICELV